MFNWLTDQYPNAIVTFIITTTARQWRVAHFMMLAFLGLRAGVCARTPVARLVPSGGAQPAASAWSPRRPSLQATRPRSQVRACVAAVWWGGGGGHAAAALRSAAEGRSVTRAAGSVLYHEARGCLRERIIEFVFVFVMIFY